MLRRTLRRLGGGGGELFPTTKEDAHLTPSWVMGRRVPPPPGPGKCYVHTTKPAIRSAWQFSQPEVHSVSLVSTQVPSPPHADIPRPSNHIVERTLAGVQGAFSPKPRSGENGIAAANIAEKQRSEIRMKTRDYAENKQREQVRPGWERTTDSTDLSEWLYKRIHDHRKLVNDNKKGYEKEYMAWEPKPVQQAMKK